MFSTKLCKYQYTEVNLDSDWILTATATDVSQEKAIVIERFSIFADTLIACDRSAALLHGLLLGCMACTQQLISAFIGCCPQAILSHCCHMILYSAQRHHRWVHSSAVHYNI